CCGGRRKYRQAIGFSRWLAIRQLRAAGGYREFAD
ncbi:hypothetical protein BZL29_7044, partial [Mycobacterium kansasii]